MAANDATTSNNAEAKPTPSAARKAQRAERPATSLTGAHTLAGWADAPAPNGVQRKPGSKSAARVEGLYVEAHKGMTLAALWAKRPECRKDLLWDYQHGHLTLGAPAPKAE